MSNSKCTRCSVDLDQSYGIIINLALINRKGQREILSEDEPSYVLCEKCWELKEDEIVQFLELL